MSPESPYIQLRFVAALFATLTVVRGAPAGDAFEPTHFKPTALTELSEGAGVPDWIAGRDWTQTSRNCLPLDQGLLSSLNLTEAERAVLPYLCQPRNTLAQIVETPRIPDGIDCQVTKWCDSSGVCSKVCKRGTVKIEPWLRNALKTQLAISRQASMCLATLPGTHNSGITLADGYGNLDPQFQDYFRWIQFIADDAKLRTNDHYFSLTDQMNLGVRSVELDTHLVGGALRIAHCGGYHGDLDVLISAVNVVAKLLGHPIHWDTETIGCNPSLSSIPVMEQRTFLSALREVAAWLALPGNEHEFVVLYLDDQQDLADWGALPQLLLEIQMVFPPKELFTPLELQSDYNGTWPSIDTLSAAGKRVLFVTGYDYGEAIDTFMFSKEGRMTVCGWREPELKTYVGSPECLADGNPKTGKTLSGTLFRILTCDLYYGPMNCDFVWGIPNAPLLDESSLPDVYQCGVNMPSPDLLTPQKAAATIWSWAPGEPFRQPTQPGEGSLLSSLVGRARVGIESLRRSLQASQQCAAIGVKDGRWRALDCTARLPTACRGLNGNWTISSSGRGECPSGTAFELPQNAKENLSLRFALEASLQGSGDPDSTIGAWLPLQGPDWKVPGSHLYSSPAGQRASFLI